MSRERCRPRPPDGAAHPHRLEPRPAGVGLFIALYFTSSVIGSSRAISAELVFTTPTEAFWTYMKVAMILGLFIAMPPIIL